MSLILDALNRSHEEIDEVPTLATRHEYAGRQPGNRLLQAVAVALLAALVTIAWLLWDRDQEVPGSVAVQSTHEKTVSPQREETSAPESRPRVPEPAVAATTKPVAGPTAEPTSVLQAQQPTTANASVSALYDKGTATDSRPQVTLPPTAAPDIVKPQQPAAKEIPAAPATATVAEQAVDIEQLLKSAEDELQNARLEEHSAPFVNGLSQRTKDTIPSIFYERHDYSGRPGQSRVVLNGKELKVGGSPASGVKVEEILPDSVVLNYRGTEFRLRALNSWVNL
ncbi:MAG: general secretion pathway protein GspB [Halioglobus sp.]